MTTAPSDTTAYDQPNKLQTDTAFVSPALSAQATKRLEELNVYDRQSVLFFGSAAQESLTGISDSMLEQVRAKDLGSAGELLNDMVLTLRGFDKAASSESRPVGWFGRILGKTRGAAGLLQRYEKVRDQIDVTANELQRHQNDLLFDIEALDRLYSANLAYAHDLEAYIDAGDAKLAELERGIADAAVRNGDSAVQETVDVHRIRDLRAVRDGLARRVHDLRLTRQVALQALPSLRMVQDNDRSLVAQIDSALANTLPLWRQQLAQAVTIQRAKDAAQTIAAANDLTNDLLRANAENLREANRETREQIERGVFDIEAIADANRVLIDTINDSLRIANEGHKVRAKATGQLKDMENQLRRAIMVSATSRDA